MVVKENQKTSRTRDVWFVYILECENNRYYTGITKDVDQRFEKHRLMKGARFTKSNPVKRVIYKEKCGKIGDALRRESAIKKLTRKEKEILVKNE